MAEGKRIYEIKINGLQESYEGVKSLREALNTLSDTVENVSKEEQKISASRKETAAGTDALAKATQKLNEWDRSYQTELALVNKELSDNKKEIKDAIKLQEAQAVVDAKQLDSYRDKQTYLSALNTLIRNHSTATEEDRAAIDAMVQESAQLQAELKATDEQMKIYVRNVGNYPGAAEMVVDSHQSIKAELKSLKTEMADMLANGVSKTDEAYLQLAERAGHLKDAIKDANEDVTNFASDTRGLTNAVNLATSAVNAWQLYNSVVALTGDENQEVAESMEKMMAIMTLLNSLQQVQNSLLENGSATARIYSKTIELVKSALGLKKKAVEEDKAATEGSTKANLQNQVSEEKDAAAKKVNAGAAKTEKVATDQSTLSTQKDTVSKQLNEQATNKMSIAQRAGAVASKTLSVALRAIPLMLIIGLVVELISRWEEIWNWLRKTIPVLDKVGKKFDEMGGFVNAAKAALITLVDFIKNIVMNTLDGLYNILVDIFTLNWDEIGKDWSEMGKKNGEAWGNAVKKGAASAQEGITKKQNEEELKRLKQQKDHLDIEERNYKTHSKKYRDMVDRMYKLERELAKGNADKLHEIDVQYARDKAALRDQDMQAAEEAAKKRKEAANKAVEEAKKEAQRRAELIKSAEEQIQKVYEISRKAREARNETEFKQLKEEEDNLVKQFIDGIDEAISEDKQMRFLSGEGLDLYLEGIKKFTAKRRLIVANELAYEAQAEKDKYNLIIKEAKEKIEELEKEEKKATGAHLDRVQTEKASLEAQIVDAETRLKDFLGKYSTETINLPIVIDIDALYDGYDKIFYSASQLIGELTARMETETDKTAKQILQNQIDNAEKAQKLLELWRPDNIVDAFLGVDNALKSVFDNALEYYYKLDDKTRETTDFNTLLIHIFDQMGEAAGFSNAQISAMRRTFVGMVEDGKDVETEVLPAMQNILAVIRDNQNQLKLMEGTWDGTKEELAEYIDTLITGSDAFKTWGVQLKDFGDMSYEQIQRLKDVGGEWDEIIKKIANEYITAANTVISTQDKIIKRHQETTRELKFEPVMENDAFTKYFGGQILNIDKTKKRYVDLKETYKQYLETIEEGSKQMDAIEKAWQVRLDATEKLYGKDSAQLVQLKLEYESAMRTYVQEREKASQEIKKIEDAEGQLTRQYYESLTDQMKNVYSQFSENVFQPLAEGFGALLDFQLEEAQEALEKITKLYDKAVEAREESAERLKQINDELRADEGQNKEALQQRLAEEEVLLVQREENERALQKEKEKREAEVEKKEKQQRKLELGQKLLEGIANTALGATAALKYGFPLGPVFAAIITAMGALQTAIIAKQISKLEKGGKVGEQGVSRSHKQGGHRIEDTNIEVEGGEWVINRKSSKKYDSLLRSINDDNVGLVQKQVEIIRERRIINNGQPVRFADGGQINTLAATRAVRDNNDIQAITDLIKQIDFEPTVSVVDINRKNKNLVRVQQYAGKAG